jgi:hypothetical protein
MLLNASKTLVQLTLYASSLDESDLHRGGSGPDPITYFGTLGTQNGITAVIRVAVKAGPVDL